MKENFLQKRLSDLLDLLKEIDEKDGELTYILNENGIEINPDYTSDYEKIGKRFVDLIGPEGGYLTAQIDKLIHIIEILFANENIYAEITQNDIIDLICGYDGKDFKREKEKLFNRVNNVIERPGYDDVFDFDISNEIAKNEDFEPPRFYNDDVSKWKLESDTIITYDLEGNREALHGIVIPKEFYDFFEISEEDLLHTFDNLEGCKKVKLFHKRGFYDGDILGLGESALLIWFDLRKYLLRKYPDFFPYVFRGESSLSFIRMIFDRTLFESNHFIKIGFEVIET